MGYLAKLVSRAAFRKGNAVYCGHINPVTAGMWSGGVVGLKSILGVKKRVKALWIMNQLQDFGYISYSLDPKTKQLTYQINDWVLKCSGAECKDGAVYATEGYGFLCLPRNITERLVGKRTFEEADAWLDLWCHTTYGDYGNAFSFLGPAILTRARNDITISYWPMNLLMGSLSETSAYHLMCYAPVDLKESFEFVRKVALNGKDEEILKLYYDLGFSL